MFVQKSFGLALVAVVLAAFTLHVGAVPVPEDTVGSSIGLATSGTTALSGTTGTTTTAPSTPASTAVSPTQPASTPTTSAAAPNEVTVHIFRDETLDDPTRPLSVTNCQGTFPRHPSQINTQDILDTIVKERAGVSPFIATVPVQSQDPKRDGNGKCLQCFLVWITDRKNAVFVVSVNTSENDRAFSVGADAFKTISGGSNDDKFETSVIPAHSSHCGL